jgi:diadenosine tetraphosphate (Ap4A) HIT family hydrolase
MDDSVTLHANASGRLWHEDPERWRAMLTRDGCPWCQGPGPPADDVIAETETCWVTTPVVAPLAGYACVSTKEHATEPYDLDAETQAKFWADAMAVARGLADAIGPAKMNYEIHGNTIPHLHMHLYPRTAGDPYVGYPIHNRAIVTRTPAELTEMTRCVRAALAALESTD